MCSNYLSSNLLVVEQLDSRVEYFVIEFLLPNMKPSSTTADNKTTQPSMQQLHIFGNFVLLPVSIVERRTSLSCCCSSSDDPILVLFLPRLEVFVGLYIYIHFLGGNDFKHIYDVWQDDK